MEVKQKHPDWALAHKKPGTKINVLMEDIIFIA